MSLENVTLLQLFYVSLFSVLVVYVVVSLLTREKDRHPRKKRRG
jgi:Na+/H+ antiporter NhaD/arsenite permease-like protein